MKIRNSRLEVSQNSVINIEKFIVITLASEKENPSKKFRRHAYAYLKKEICNRVGENPNPPVELKKIIRPGTNHFF